ncbi:hypothetical protein OA88_12970 [Flavobacterium sp. JRM]|nr:hypothetical protein OA88_12970 [Flavobacterium sp. JRM]
MKLKNILLIGLTFLFLFACENKENLDTKFRNLIINYQKQYPIPTEKQRKFKPIYLYSVKFKKKLNDTIIEITRTSSGIDSVISKRSGDGAIYEDKELKPTLIMDNDKLGNRFVLKKINKIDKKYYNRSDIFDEGFTPIHTYKITGEKIELIQVDTIWKHWD